MVKVELGCGNTKREGYIGVDRFPLPDVDVVADLNGALPFDSDSVDTVWACHSLEHLSNLSHTFAEIYRVTKHGSVIQVLAPYYFSTLNISNFYHQSAWTEDTPRLFDLYPTDMVNKKDYLMPHALTWGLAESDNSNPNYSFQIVKEEFFYFPEYCHLSDEHKRQARRSMLNVCDQIFIVMVVNKEKTPLSVDELQSIAAQVQEPDILQVLRERDRKAANEPANSIYDILQEHSARANISERQLMALVRENEKQSSKIEKLSKQICSLKENLDSQRRTIEFKERDLAHRVSSLADIEKDVTRLLKTQNRAFYDDLLMNDDNKGVRGVYFSKDFPVNGYLEFPVPASFSKLTVCVMSILPTEVFTELVADGTIIQQESCPVDGLQFIRFRNDRIYKRMFLRLRLTENAEDTICRVLMVRLKKKKEEKLAYSLQ